MRDGPTTNRYGFLDRGTTLFTCEPRNQIFPIVDRFGQSGDLRAFTQVIGSHCEGDINWELGLVGCRQQKLNKSCRGLLPCDPTLAKPEQFFKLIHYDQQARIR